MYEARTIHVGRDKEMNPKNKYPKNVVRNQKYSIFTFLPVVKLNFIFHTKNV